MDSNQIDASNQDCTSYILIHKIEAEMLQKSLEENNIISTIQVIQEKGATLYEINIESNDTETIEKCLEVCQLSQPQNTEFKSLASTKKKYVWILIILILLMIVLFRMKLV